MYRIFYTVYKYLEEVRPGEHDRRVELARGHVEESGGGLAARLAGRRTGVAEAQVLPVGGGRGEHVGRRDEPGRRGGMT